MNQLCYKMISMKHIYMCICLGVSPLMFLYQKSVVEFLEYEISTFLQCQESVTKRLSFHTVDDLIRCMISKSLVKKMFQKTYFPNDTLDIEKLEGDVFQVVYNCRLERVNIGQIIVDCLPNVKEMKISQPKYKMYPPMLKNMIEALKGVAMSGLQKHSINVALMKVNSLLVEMEPPKTKREVQPKKDGDVKVKQLYRAIQKFTVDITVFMKLQLTYCDSWQRLIDDGLYMQSPCSMFHDKLTAQLVTTQTFITNINETVLKPLKMVDGYTPSPFLQEALEMILLQFIILHTDWPRKILGDRAIQKWNRHNMLKIEELDGMMNTNIIQYYE